MKALGWIKDYREKALVSGDKSVRITIEFQDEELEKAREVVGYKADKPYLIIIEDNASG